MTASKRLLFICTGNYYRSRFAEAVFNHMAEERALPWKAFSRGLAIHWAPGPLSQHTREGLAKRGIDLRHTADDRVQIQLEDFISANLVIALKGDEHRPMVTEMFPAWSEKIVYWDVTDLPEGLPEVALPAIEEQVRLLVALLEDEEKKAAASRL